MGLFGKKKLTFGEILEDLEALSPEEKEQVKARMNETPSEAPEAVSEPENSETPAVPENIEEAATEEQPTEETPEIDPESEAEPNRVEENNAAEILAGISERVKTLEASISEFVELKSKMEEYVNKQKESFGYRSDSRGAYKDYNDMSADELKSHILGN